MKNILSIILLILLIFLGIVVSIVLYNDVEERTLNNQYKQHETYANQAARSIEIFFENFSQSLEFISNKNEIINFSNDTKQFLKNYFEAHIEVLKAVTRVSAEGKILYTYPYIEDAIGKDLSSQAHNKQIMEHHEPVISDVFQTVQGYRAIVYAYPVFKDSVYNGSISLVIPFDYLANKFLDNIRTGKTGTIILISELGYELFCEQKGHVGEKINVNSVGYDSLQVMVTKMLNGESGRAEYSYHALYSSEIVDKIAFYRSINLQNTYWSIAVIMNKDEILEANRGFVYNLSILLLLVLLVIIIFLFFIAKQRKKSREILRKKELKYQSNLEKLVGVRTEELKELNVSLQNDITERKKIEKELILALERVEKSEKIKSEFLAQMSHEIRTPINTILSFNSLIREELSQYASEDLQYGFTGIQSAGKRLIRTIDLILNMSDIQLGTHEYLPKKVDIYEDIIRELEMEYRLQVNEKNLEFIIKIETDNTSIILDIYSVNQIFANLIDNAIKYTPNGFIAIKIFRNEDNKLSVSVKDSGVGISEEYLPRLFDEFSQEDMGYSRKYDGNGLGLALVKKYCEMNNAEIIVTSKKGEGSEFRVVFNS